MKIWVLTKFSSLDRTLQHLFLPRLLGRLETLELLAWVSSYCRGSDLNVLRHRQNNHIFFTGSIQFYLVEILCSRDHLHSLGVVYRDLKPETSSFNNKVTSL
ncbi:hypothetical protein V6N11_026482 [Hibiscus sabdariffa]|uniref:non-specific serine/threonine protein kinase n=1 Tax=Hibiscus sabdariffa TaxID=183260 RepID=A0ABR2SWR2_9ROSI